MKKIRIESLEHLIGSDNESEIVKMGFQLADQCIREMRQIGIEMDFLETLILLDKEYHRTDWLIGER
jgi:hypothetical protein